MEVTGIVLLIEGCMQCFCVLTCSVGRPVQNPADCFGGSFLSKMKARVSGVCPLFCHNLVSSSLLLSTDEDFTYFHHNAL